MPAPPAEIAVLSPEPAGLRTRAGSLSPSERRPVGASGSGTEITENSSTLDSRVDESGDSTAGSFDHHSI